LFCALARAAPSALRETGFALAVAALVFPAFALGFRAYHAHVLGESLDAFQLTWPEELPSYLATQLLVVALPEEALFRGYFQGRLTQASRVRLRLAGRFLSPSALLGQAALFALIHVAVEPHPGRLAVFFPGLLFGVVRELRGGIGAAVLLHAASNLLGDVLARSWL
jgi:membrane protease YdiL (CAAX protease family)